MTSDRHPHDSRRMLLFLAAMVALGPLTVDMYLPAMPAMQRAFATDIAHMHLTLSAYLLGFALFHLACGPLADRFGRRPVLFGGTALYVAASLGCAFALSVDELIQYRLVQGIGACVGPTLARTITRDVFGPVRAARALSLIAMMMALAPAIAPGIGGIMLRYFTWHSVFFFLALYGGAICAMIVLYMPETLPKPQSLHPARIAANYSELLLHPSFMTTSVCGALIYAGLMAYLSSSGFIFIDMLGVPVEYFGTIFLTTVVGYISGSGLSARLSGRWQPRSILLLGSVLAVVATSTMFAANLLWPTSVVAIVLPMTLYALAMGLSLPQAMAMVLQPFPHIAGTASALMGFVQMGLAAAITALVGRVVIDSPRPLTVSMLAIAAGAALLAAWVYYRRGARAAEH